MKRFLSCFTAAVMLVLSLVSASALDTREAVPEETFMGKGRVEVRQSPRFNHIYEFYADVYVNNGKVLVSGLVCLHEMEYLAEVQATLYESKDGVNWSKVDRWISRGFGDASLSKSVTAKSGYSYYADFSAAARKPDGEKLEGTSATVYG